MTDAKMDAGLLTTIRVQKTTREKLTEIGSYRESLDDIVLRLIDYWDKQHQKNNYD